MQKENNWRASFLTPIKRYNSTHFTDGGTYQKFSDLSSESLLKINKTCVESVKGRVEHKTCYIVQSFSANCSFKSQ